MNKNYPKIYPEDIKVLGRVVSISTENKVAAAEQVFDEKFNYSNLIGHTIDSTASTTRGLDQYTINRLFGEKLKALDDAGLIPDVDGFLQNIKINNITVKGGGTFTGDVTFNDNVTVKKKLNVDGGIDSKGIIRCNDVIVGWNGSDNSGYSVKDAIDRINKIISGENKDNTLWRYILGLEGRIRTLEACCEEMHNQPQGGITLTVSPTSLNMNVGDTKEITVTSEPALAGSPTATSSDPSVASVTVSGGKVIVTGKKAGTATITIEWGGARKTVQVTVVDSSEPTPTQYRIQWDGNSYGSINGTSSGSVYVDEGTSWSNVFNLNKVNDDTYALLNVRTNSEPQTYISGFESVRIDDATYTISIPSVDQDLIITWQCYNTAGDGGDKTYGMQWIPTSYTVNEGETVECYLHNINTTLFPAPADNIEFSIVKTDMSGEISDVAIVENQGNNTAVALVTGVKAGYALVKAHDPEGRCDDAYCNLTVYAAGGGTDIPERDVVLTYTADNDEAGVVYRNHDAQEWRPIDSGHLVQQHFKILEGDGSAGSVIWLKANDGYEITGVTSTWNGDAPLTQDSTWTEIAESDREYGEWGQVYTQGIMSDGHIQINTRKIENPNTGNTFTIKTNTEPDGSMAIFYNKNKVAVTSKSISNGEAVYTNPDMNNFPDGVAYGDITTSDGSNDNRVLWPDIAGPMELGGYVTVDRNS